MSLEIDHDLFNYNSKSAKEIGVGKFETQFDMIYKKRLEQISPSIEPIIPQPYCKINSIVQSEKGCSLIGIVYKELKKRPNILKEYKELTGDTSSEELSPSENDIIFLEDLTDRIQLIGVDPSRLVTGIIIGVYGHIESFKFNVTTIFEPTPEIPPQIHTASGKIVFISDLACDSENFRVNKNAAKRLGEIMKQSSLTVLLGNNFDAPSKPNSDELLSFQSKMQSIKSMPVQKLESFISVARVKTILIPGQNDPVSIRLPQLPYHKVLIKSPNIELCTNPAWFTYEGVTFLCGAGESVKSIQQTSSLSFHEAQQSILKWHHYAPTAPDYLPCMPVTKKDLMVIEKLPNFFVCGLADNFEVSEVNGTTVISVPSFNNTLSAVTLDLETGEAILEECKID
ncbi:DNA polymerase delta small subunit [Histomonas meleagridis]|uniref:DNA polymerase delta small subunit n=1 Tax=Histomonas meleagridis TaxID=135588 RepID=UPI00355A1185|nr:DNA polymerase delta small subunit [Histomonas meleagridis]KAH0796170.1 DNA polymerase delta small subunit [Histomonas meleagridis]